MKPRNILVGLLSIFVLVSFYVSFIHNQYFSNIASFDKKIKLGRECNNVLSSLEKYQISSPKNIFVKKLDISSTPEWKHKKEVASTIIVSDLSTPFTTINYYVFCSQKGIVLNTLLTGD